MQKHPRLRTTASALAPFGLVAIWLAAMLLPSAL